MSENQKIKREENTTYIATISGGKDSVTMCDLLLKNGYPVDYIIFNDTLAEFEDMYIYLEKVKEYFKNRYKKEITVLKPNKTPEEHIFGKIKREDAKRVGFIRGVFNPLVGFCEWRKIAKITPTEKFLTSNKIKKYKLYIGFTIDETSRANREDGKFIYPLIDYFNMSETNCQEYLIKQDMENPLYRDFTRTGCSFCPAGSKKHRYNLYKNHNKVWEYMKKIENVLDSKEKQGERVIQKYWYSDGSMTDMEKIFKEKDKQGSLFDFSDEPLKDCFCKI